MLLGTGALAVVLAAGDDPEPRAAASSPTPNLLPTGALRLGGSCAAEGSQVTGDGGQKLVCAAGRWVTPEEAPKPTTPDSLVRPVGGTFQVTSPDGTEALYTLTKTKTVTKDEYGDRPKRGVFLLVHITADVKSGSEYVCSCSFSFVTSSGRSYEPAYQPFKGHEELPSDDLAGGQNVDGWIGFDLPKSALKGGRIAFKPDSFGGDVAYWTL